MDTWIRGDTNRVQVTVTDNGGTTSLVGATSKAALSVTVGGFAGWTTTNNFQMQDNGLSQSVVDAILWELYQASAAPRTVSGGTINVGGSNAAPSGTFQAVASPPVSAATPGKEIAYELLNDSLGLFNNWATVTITA